MFLFKIILYTALYFLALWYAKRAIRKRKFSSAGGALSSTDYGRKAVWDGILYIILATAVYGWLLYKLFSR